jgi:RNA polymerase sigma-70 factor (ECF subfamily)
MESTTNQPDPRQQFMDLMTAHPGIIHKVTRLWCRNHADRDELAQQILAETWRAFPSWNAKRKFSTWLYRIALNVAISDLRKRKRRDAVSIDDRVEQLVEHSGTDPALLEQIQDLYRFIDQLDPLHRGLSCSIWKITLIGKSPRSSVSPNRMSAPKSAGSKLV